VSIEDIIQNAYGETLAQIQAAQAAQAAEEGM